MKQAELAYEIMGAGEPVLLLHGLGGTRRNWRLQVAALAARYRVITCDLPGHGESDPPRRYDMAQYAETVALFLRALELGRVHIVGLSLGGMVAFQLALDHPELVLSLTIVNSAPEVIARGLRQHLQVGLRLLVTRVFGPKGMAQLLVRRLFPKPEQEALREETLREIGANDRRGYLKATRSIFGWSVKARLAQIACPTLVVSGDRDYTPVADKAAWMRGLRDAELVVIADSGHVTPLDQPARFNHELLRFLDGVASGQRRPMASAPRDPQQDEPERSRPRPAE